MLMPVEARDAMLHRQSSCGLYTLGCGMGSAWPAKNEKLIAAKRNLYGAGDVTDKDK
jgi:hypothetical protein